MKNSSKTINWICGGIAAYFAGITIAGAIKRKREQESTDKKNQDKTYERLNPEDMVVAIKEDKIVDVVKGVGEVDWGAYAEYVNKPKDGRQAYVVKLWGGAGYLLDLFVAYADDEEEALERVVAYLDKNNNERFFWDDSTEEDEDGGLVIYIDATMEGAKRPHYVIAENMEVIPVSKNNLPYNWAKRGKYKF